MAGQSVLNELILEPQYNEGPRDWQNWLTKMNFHYVGVCFLYFTITGVKNNYRSTTTFFYNDNP